MNLEDMWVMDKDSLFSAWFTDNGRCMKVLRVLFRYMLLMVQLRPLSCPLPITVFALSSLFPQHGPLIVLASSSTFRASLQFQASSHIFEIPSKLFAYLSFLSSSTNLQGMPLHSYCQSFLYGLSMQDMTVLDREGFTSAKKY